MGWVAAAAFFGGFTARSLLTWVLYMAKGQRYNPVTETRPEAEA